MPAAAVIPAPAAYIKVVVIKRFVVDCRVEKSDAPLGLLSA